MPSGSTVYRLKICINAFGDRASVQGDVIAMKVDGIGRLSNPVQ
jgi:hypothetical protein